MSFSRSIGELVPRLRAASRDAAHEIERRMVDKAKAEAPVRTGEHKEGLQGLSLGQSFSVFGLLAAANHSPYLEEPYTASEKIPEGHVPGARDQVRLEGPRILAKHVAKVLR